jgi:hypothetical protein
MKILKIEEQFAPNWMAYLLSSLGVMVLIYTCVQNIEAPPKVFLMYFGIMFLYIFIVSMFSLKMLIEISVDEIRYKWSRIQRQFTVIPKADIQQIIIRRVHAISEFGGIGIRYRKGYTAYLLGGNYGLDIQWGNKKRIFSLSDSEKVKLFLKGNGYI